MSQIRAGAAVVAVVITLAACSRVPSGVELAASGWGGTEVERPTGTPPPLAVTEAPSLPEADDPTPTATGSLVAEDATVDALYGSPLHPYTAGLLGALPVRPETVIGESTVLLSLIG